METVNRSRCGWSLVRCGLTSAWRCPCQAFWVVRSSARHQRRTQLRSFSPYWWSRNPSTVERWGCGECAFGAAGCVAFGSGSMCRWRRSAVVRIPAFRAGDRDGRNAATPGRNGIPQRSERRNASSAEAAGGASAANVASSMVPNYRAGQLVTGLSQAARDGARQRASILDYRRR